MRKHSPEKSFPCTFSVPIGTLICTQLLVNSAKTERRLHLSPKVRAMIEIIISENDGNDRRPLKSGLIES